MRYLVAVLAALCAACAGSSFASAQVLRVGSYHRIPGQFTSIQSAVNAAHPGDKILVAPGDYKTTAVHFPAGNSTFPAAILITTGGLTLRGMNRGGVVVDGTKPGTPPCSNAAPDQTYGAGSSASTVGGYVRARASDGASGVNGVMVYKAPNVAVENLSACNFLGGTGDAGNAIWWNGGDGSGKIGGYGYTGSYLTTTSTFFHGESTAAAYGIFSSNWSGGTWDQIYGSNFNDSAFYIGACQDVCNHTVDHAWAEFNALGYSGSNSGGNLVVENSQFDNNQDGFDTNSQNGDNPPPQNGACPGNGISPITHTHSCWVFMDNYVHDNNNPNVPTAGSAASGPVGTGMSLSGTRNDTVMHNRFANNGAWGQIMVPYPDSGPPCTGGTQTNAACIYDESGNALIGNVFSHNGFFHNPTNGDFAEVTLEGGPTDCFSANTDTSGGPVTSSPSGLQQSKPSCNGNIAPANGNFQFLTQVACDSGAAIGPAQGSTSCLLGGNYPRRRAVVMHPLPSGLPTMPHVCSGVAVDPWCNDTVSNYPRCAARFVSPKLTLNLGERFTGVTTRVNRRRSMNHRAKGSRTRIRFFLTSARHRRVRVHFVMHIKVGKHRETTRFTRIYHRC